MTPETAPTDGDDATANGGDSAPLRETVAALVADWPDVEETTMFGCPSFRAGGELFAVVSAQGLPLTRLPDDVRTRLAACREVRAFDANGRRVERWATVAVAPDAVPALEEFVAASYDAARAA